MQRYGNRVQYLLRHGSIEAQRGTGHRAIKASTNQRTLAFARAKSNATSAAIPLRTLRYFSRERQRPKEVSLPASLCLGLSKTPPPHALAPCAHRLPALTQPFPYPAHNEDMPLLSYCSATAALLPRPMPFRYPEKPNSKIQNCPNQTTSQRINE